METDLKLLIALGSLIIHYEEWTSEKSHPIDKDTINSIRNQQDVKKWFEDMNKQGFLPIKRG